MSRDVIRGPQDINMLLLTGLSPDTHTHNDDTFGHNTHTHYFIQIIQRVLVLTIILRLFALERGETSWKVFCCSLVCLWELLFDLYKNDSKTEECSSDY